VILEGWHVGAVLEITTGPLAGKKVSLKARQAIVVGRAGERAEFAVPHDNLMSGVHFAVECGAAGCRVVDKKSTNGTFLNGARIQEAVLANGDEIKSGQTIFVVRIASDDQPLALSSSPVAATPKSPAPAAPPAALPSLPAALVIGSWAFHKIPEHWQIQDGLGIQQIVKDAFPASVGLTEEPMGPGIALAQYVEAHTKMFRDHLPEPKIDAAASPAIHGSEETAALNVRYTIKDGPSVCYHRVYARSGSTIGVITLTALEKDLPSIRPIYDSVLSTISFSHREQA
jgi:pSer/pThr/pTyr-binding forkhead associated (FHA) protein